MRGLDYYSRTAFEFVSTTLETSQSTVLGGGRYDGLAELLGGKPAPGVGFAAGIDRILMATSSPQGAVLGCILGGGEAGNAHRSDGVGGHLSEKRGCGWGSIWTSVA